MYKHKCKADVCYKFVDVKGDYCDRHKHMGKIDKQTKTAKNKVYNQNTRFSEQNIKYAKFYQSTDWRHTRNLYISNNPLCEICYENGRYAEGKIVHHKVEIKTDWSRRLDITNLQTVCHRCHNKIHAEDKEHHSKYHKKALNEEIKKYGED